MWLPHSFYILSSKSAANCTDNVFPVHVTCITYNMYMHAVYALDEN